MGLGFVVAWLVGVTGTADCPDVFFLLAPCVSRIRPEGVRGRTELRSIGMEPPELLPKISGEQVTTSSGGGF
jgi:hypothetical protein